MATQLQLRKGTKVQNDAFTGAEGELTYDSTSKGLRLHDGVQQGGYMVDPVVAWQAPTAENNYTWYRKYADGWVEQGGHNHAIQADRSGNFNYINLPVTMADANYTANAVLFGNYDVSIGVIPGNSSTTRLCIGGLYTATSDTRYTAVDWQVSGMAAQ